VRTLHAGELTLEPQTAAHAAGMFVLLADPALYLYLDDDPPADEAWLAARFGRLESRRSADGLEHWLNWVIRPPGNGLVGFVQATVYPGGAADVAYLLGGAFRGRGWARRSTGAMLKELARSYGVRRAYATVDRRNQPSLGLLQRLGFSEVAARIHPHHAVAAGDSLLLREPTFDARIAAD
jgi:RimJ/RimL family protein N-acetyltransferase